MRSYPLTRPALRTALRDTLSPNSPKGRGLFVGESFAKPKSRIFAWVRAVTKMFAGLMSRWMIPLECAASRPSAI